MFWDGKHLEIIERNKDKPWNWGYISVNPNLTFEFIEQHPEIDWSWSDDGICDNTFSKSRKKWMERKRLEIIKTLQIQRHWRNSISNPIYKLARKKIKEEYNK